MLQRMEVTAERYRISNKKEEISNLYLAYLLHTDMCSSHCGPSRSHASTAGNS